MTEAQQAREEKDELRQDFRTGMLTLVAIFSFFGMVAAIAGSVYGYTNNDNTEEIAQGNRDRACVSSFAGRVTDRLADSNTAASDLLVALAAQASGALSGIDVDPAGFSDAVHEVLKAKQPYLTANAAYQKVVASQVDDRDQFDKLCKLGPPD